MMRYLLSIVALVLVPVSISAQDTMEGEVTFLTAEHAYVKFANTSGISVKDTLEVIKEGKGLPCLIVNSMSSTSCVCTVAAGCKVGKQDRVRTRRLRSVTTAIEQKRTRTVRGGTRTGQVDPPGGTSERIRGRISAATYSTIPSARENDHRAMYRLSLDADNIADSKFSAETYLNYRQLFPSDLETHPQRTEYFTVYSLAMNWAPDTNSNVTLGRRVNNNVSSLGAIDGLQAERRFGRFHAGAIAGFRPDIFTYDLNTHLLEYGGYIGTAANTNALKTKTTIGFLQQTNSGMVDRRYAYFQHTSTFNGNLNIFGSGELDLYNNITGEARLTNLFISSRYRIGRMVDLFASYDRRQRVIFYETFRNDVEILLDDDDASQGARLRVNVKATKKFGLGAAYSRRFQADGANASDNIQAFFNISMDPDGVGRWSVQLNRNTSNYMRSDIYSVRHSRTIVPKYLTMSFYYRSVQYSYADRSDGDPLADRSVQSYYGADASVNLARTFTFTVLGELNTLEQERNYRINLSLTKRFDSKRKR